MLIYYFAFVLIKKRKEKCFRHLKKKKEKSRLSALVFFLSAKGKNLVRKISHGFFFFCRRYFFFAPPMFFLIFFAKVCSFFSLSFLIVFFLLFFFQKRRFFSPTLSFFVVCFLLSKDSFPLLFIFFLSRVTLVYNCSLNSYIIH